MGAGGLIIRAFAAADAAAVVGLVHQLNVFEDGISGDRATDLAAAEACLAADQARVARDGGALLVASDGAEIVGFLVLAYDPPQPYLNAHYGRIAWVSELVVDERSRGQGIGTALLAEAERITRATGIRRLMIGAIVGNVAARRAYEKFGFRPAVVELSKDIAP